MHRPRSNLCNQWFILQASAIRLLTIVSTSRVFAVDPHKLISQYAHSAWATEDGRFSGVPFLVAQTSDGYSWIGTSVGLLRLDGVCFARWGEDSQDALSTNSITALMETNDGGLWIADRDSVENNHIRYLSGGKLVTYNNARLETLSFSRDRKGDTWTFESSYPDGAGAKLCKLAGDNIQCCGERDGLLLFVNEHELQIVDPKHLPSNPKPPPVHIEDAIADRKEYAIDKDLLLPVHTRNVEID
jgi:hypothetical protein